MTSMGIGALGFILGGVFATILSTILAEKVSARQRRMQWEMPQSINHDNPPHYATYTRARGDLPAQCTCHGDDLADGQRILVWPTEQLLCERTFGDGQ